MRPLSASTAPALLERIESARGAELRTISMNNPTTFVIVFSLQDKNRGFDWINLAFEINGVHDARLIDESKLEFVNMSDGISILFEDGNCGFIFGDYKALTSANDSMIYLIGKSIKYEELPFSE